MACFATYIIYLKSAWFQNQCYPKIHLSPEYNFSIKMRIHGFLTILFAFLLAGTSHGFVGPSCLKIRDTLGDRPDGIYEQFQKEVCEKGCKPQINHYDKWAERHAVKPAVRSAMLKMGMPTYVRVVDKLADEVVKVIKEKCARNVKGHLCQDPSTLRGFGDCLKGNLMPVVMGRITDLLPLVTEANCVKESKYLDQSELWETEIPYYFKQYARVCNKL